MTTTQPFEAWELPARLALADLGVGHHLADPVIDDVRARCETTGRSPRDVAGDPREFAARTAAEQPPGSLERVDRNGMTAGEYLSGQLFLLTMGVIPAVPLIAAIEGTWMFSATAAGLAGLALLTVAVFLAFSVPQALRASGRPRLAGYCYPGSALAGAAAIPVFLMLPAERLFPVPALAIVGVAAVALAALLRDPKEPSAKPARQMWDAEAWLDHLAGLLIGRYDLPAERAAELTRETRARLAASGRNPEQEFGSVDDYARRLQRDEPERTTPFWQGRTAGVLRHLATAGLGVWIGTDWYRDGVWWAALFIALPLTLGAVGLLIRQLRGDR